MPSESFSLVEGWLADCLATSAPEDQLPAELLNPYSEILAGNIEDGVRRLENFLREKPEMLEAAILLACASTFDNLQHWQPPKLQIDFRSSDPQDVRSRSRLLAAINLVGHPLVFGSLPDSLFRDTLALRVCRLLQGLAHLCLIWRFQDGAITCLARALQICPEQPVLYTQMGATLFDAGQDIPAMELLQAAECRFPDDHGICRALSLLYRAESMPEKACRYSRRLFRRDPENFVDACNYYCFVPGVFSSPEEASRLRRRALRGLTILSHLPYRSPETFTGGWQIPSFSLAYTDANNRKLLEKQARVVQRAYQPFLEAIPRCRSTPILASCGRVRIGFLSEFFRFHTNSFAFEGLIKNLDKDAFDVYIIHNSDSLRDSTRDRIDSYGKEAIVLPASLQSAGETMLKLDLDILFYPDIGMSPSLYLLALARLAPVQVTSWGLPHTSGIPTIDAYISSALAEPPQAQRHYSERLYLSSRLPCCYLSSNLPAHTEERSFFFLPEEQFIFGCLQQLHKLHPDFDDILELIAIRNPDSLFVFVEHYKPFLTHRVLERWKVRAPTMLEQTRLLARVDRDHFVALCGCVDLLLDPPYYGSGISFYESAHTGTPTLSLKGRMLRSRYIAAAYEMIGLKDAPVCHSPEQYVELATELAQGNPGRLDAIKEQLRFLAPSLYDDLVYVSELEGILRHIIA